MNSDRFKNSILHSFGADPGAVRELAHKAVDVAMDYGMTEEVALNVACIFEVMGDCILRDMIKEVEADAEPGDARLEPVMHRIPVAQPVLPLRRYIHLRDPHVQTAQIRRIRGRRLRPLA